MRNLIAVALAVSLAALAVSCRPGGNGATHSAHAASQPAGTQDVPRPGTSATAPGAACTPTSGEGTVPPAVAVGSITFLVDDAELTVSEGDSLHAPPGSDVRVLEVTICAGTFVAPGGEACVDFAPTRASGEEVSSEHAGTHMVPLTLGLITLPGLDRSWTIDETWQGLAVVVNHWPGVKTEDHGCAEGLCERDHRFVLPLR